MRCQAVRLYLRDFLDRAFLRRFRVREYTCDFRASGLHGASCNTQCKTFTLTGDVTMNIIHVGASRKKTHISPDRKMFLQTEKCCQSYHDDMIQVCDD